MTTGHPPQDSQHALTPDPFSDSGLDASRSIEFDDIIKGSFAQQADISLMDDREFDDLVLGREDSQPVPPPATLDTTSPAAVLVTTQEPAAPSVIAPPGQNAAVSADHLGAAGDLAQSAQQANRQSSSEDGDFENVQAPVVYSYNSSQADFSQPNHFQSMQDEYPGDDFGLSTDASHQFAQQYEQPHQHQPHSNTFQPASEVVFCLFVCLLFWIPYCSPGFHFPFLK